MNATDPPGSPPVFELAGISSTTTHSAGADLLGLWRTAGPAVSTSSALPTRAAGPPLWRVNLPADRVLAREWLGECGKRLGEGERRLSSVPDRLQLVLGGVTDEVAFAEPAVRRPSTAEQELAAWLQDVHGRQVAVAFGTGDARAKSDSSRQDARAVSWWQSVARDVTVLARRIALCCSPTTWVESRVGEDIVGRSLLGLGGELRTAWRAGTGCDEVRLHCGSLALISASRSALLRVLALAAQGALAISVRLALPGGAVLALPAAWRFAHRVMQETGGLGSLERPVRT